ncbi:MAG TPA: amidohydrolase family protein [Geobacteraceae bacterium]|nr:amidohydrolase family protein [Geobacteraceae bacterium]
MPQKSPRIDAHCHLFNAFYLTGEIAEILWDTLWGKYPHKAEALKAMRGVSLKDIRSWLEDLMKQVAQLSHASFGSYEDNFRLLTSAYKECFQSDEKIIVYPLMMDIHYMAAAPCFPSLRAVTPKRGGPFVKDPQRVFDELYGELRNAVLKRYDETLQSRVSTAKALAAPFTHVDVEKKLDDIYQDIAAPPDRSLKAGITDGVDLSKGFEKQVWELMKLRRAHPDTVFPFFAVDPRRVNIMDVVTKGRHFSPKEAPLVGRNGPFFGIKLYPRLGYTPADIETNCPGLFQWCRDNDIPITVHCSMTGFPPLPGCGYGEAGNPKNWEEILDRYPELRIDFAHFGRNGDGWPGKILELMKRPGSNVFTDLACYTDDGTLSTVKKMLSDNKVLRERLMFGTDFDVMLTTDLINLQKYFKQFKSAFTEDEMDAMSRDVPRSFLNREKPVAVRKAAPEIIIHGIDRQSRNTFIRQLAGRNRFGWVRDLPDIRDYSAQKDTLSRKHLEISSKKSVKEMLSSSINKAKQDIPPAVDLTHWCSPVGDQGPIGACTAHAGVALVEYFEIRTQKRHIDASRLFLYKVTRNLLNWQGDAGAYIRSTMQALVLFGIPPEHYMPYVPEDFDKEPSAFCYAFGQSYQTASYYRLDPVGTKAEKLLMDIKITLTAGYPLMFGFTVYDSMGEAKANQGKIPFPSGNDRVAGGHAMAAVGYDDTIVIQNSDPGSIPTRGAIRIRNSWGTDWGEDGYGWLPYEYVLRGLAVDWWTIIKQEWVDLEKFQ